MADGLMSVQLSHTGPGDEIHGVIDSAATLAESLDDSTEYELDLFVRESN